MHRFFSILTIALFLIFLGTPPIITLLTPDREISKTEKRKFALLPQLTWSPKQLEEFPEKFEQYYNDHFGLRDHLAFYQQLFSFKVFKISSSPIVTVGKDEWLFYNGDRAMLAYLGLTPISPVFLESYRWTLMDRRDWLAEKEIRYIFLPVPNKESIYPEFLPRRVRKNAGVSLYDQIISYLKNHPGFSEYLDLKNIFLGKKKSSRLYLKTDSHWNVNGAFLTYKHIVNKLKEQDIPVRLLRKEEIDWGTVDYSGDLAMFLNLYKFVTEIAPKMNEVKPYDKHTADLNQTQQQNKLEFEKFRHDPRNFVMVQEFSANTTSVLLIHDSFGGFLQPFLAQSFGTVYSVQRGFSEIKDFIDTVRPDVVIDQRVERNLLVALALDQSLQKELVKKQFPQSNNIRLHIDANSGDREFTSSVGVEVNSMDDGLQIQSEEQYPTLVFQYTSGDGEAPLMVRIQLSSHQQTKWLLYYTTEETTNFTPAHTLSMEVKKGYNEYFFRLPDPGSVGKIQFHPGDAPGEYLLHSFIVKRQE